MTTRQTPAHRKADRLRHERNAKLAEWLPEFDDRTTAALVRAMQQDCRTSAPVPPADRPEPWPWDRLRPLMREGGLDDDDTFIEGVSDIDIDRHILATAITQLLPHLVNAKVIDVALEAIAKANKIRAARQHAGRTLTEATKADAAVIERLVRQHRAKLLKLSKAPTHAAVRRSLDLAGHSVSRDAVEKYNR